MNDLQTIVFFFALVAIAAGIWAIAWRLGKIVRTLNEVFLTLRRRDPKQD